MGGVRVNIIDEKRDRVDYDRDIRAELEAGTAEGLKEVKSHGVDAMSKAIRSMLSKIKLEQKKGNENLIDLDQTGSKWALDDDDRNHEEVDALTESSSNVDPFEPEAEHDFTDLGLIKQQDEPEPEQDSTRDRELADQRAQN